jgi:hypothetical protein
MTIVLSIAMIIGLFQGLEKALVSQSRNAIYPNLISYLLFYDIREQNGKDPFV